MQHRMTSRRVRLAGAFIAVAAATSLLASCASDAADSPSSDQTTSDQTTSNETTSDETSQEGADEGAQTGDTDVNADEVLAQFQDKPIQAAVFNNWPPDEWVDDDNSLKGFAIDLFDAVTEHLGIEVEYTPTGFDAIIPAIQNGRFDIGIASFSVSEPRLEAVDFVSVNTNGWGMALRADSDIVVNEQKDFCGHAVAAVRGTGEIKKLEDTNTDLCGPQGLENLDLKVYPDPAAAMLALESGRVDMMSSGYAQLQYLTAAKDDLKSAGIIISPVYQSWSVSRDNPLGPVMRDALNELIADGTYGDILAKWDLEAVALDESALFQLGMPEEDMVPAEAIRVN